MKERRTAETDAWAAVDVVKVEEGGSPDIDTFMSESTCVSIRCFSRRNTSRTIVCMLSFGKIAYERPVLHARPGRGDEALAIDLRLLRVRFSLEPGAVVERDDVLPRLVVLPEGLEVGVVGKARIEAAQDVAIERVFEVGFLLFCLLCVCSIGYVEVSGGDVDEFVDVIAVGAVDAASARGVVGIGRGDGVYLVSKVALIVFEVFVCDLSSCDVRLLQFVDVRHGGEGGEVVREGGEEGGGKAGFL